MPKESLSLYMDIQSGSSERTLTSLADKTRALDKETQELKQHTEGFAKANKTLLAEQTRLQSELKSSTKTVNELQKAYDECGDELSKMRLDQAIENHAKLKQELSEVNAQVNFNQKTYKDYLEQMRKGSLSGTSGTLQNMFSVLELGKPFINSIAQLGESALTSMIGTPEASLITDTLSGAISGALAGSAAGTVLGAPGAAVGAVLGGASGLVSGGTKILEGKDDAFKDYYGGLYDNVSGLSGEMVTEGSALASGREKDRISFKTMFGDKETADQYLNSLVDMANTTPFLYDDLVSMSKTLATYGYSGDANSEDFILPLLQTIGDTGAALGMGTSDMNAVAEALGRMKSSDRVTMEYLDILNNRGIGAVGMLADAKGVSQGDMRDMISKGQVSGTEAVEIITEALSRNPEDGGYYGAMAEQSKTFAGISSTLEGLEQALQNSGGDAYNSLRVSGKSAMVDAYDGELGEALKEINAVMGENQARKENLQDQYRREVLDMVLNGNQGSLWSTFDQKQRDDLTKMSEDYARLMEAYQNGDEDAGAKLESIFERAEVLGQAYFDNSEFMKTLNQTELDEIESIRDLTAALDDATQAAYYLAQERSKGLGAAILGADVPAWSFFAWDNATDNALKQAGLTKEGIEGMREEAKAGSHAFGLARVPYDEYPALLHEGERVLTASQARAQDAGQGAAPINITITGNSFTGMPEEMADQLAEIIARRLEQAAIAAAPP